MNDAQTQQTPPTELVMPDYSNLGVAFRVLLAVNVTIFAICIVHARSVVRGLHNFIDAAVLVELACLSSIVAVYLIRRVLQYTGVISVLSVWMQRFICVFVPAFLTALVVAFLQPYEWFRTYNGYLSAYDGAVMGTLFGIAFQHYFELRARAFSPALAEARLQALQARIHPHFLFNSLNAVLSLIRKEPRQAETALEDLADLFRVSMRDTREMTTLAEEIRLCQQYLSIEKIRLGDRLQVQWDTSAISDEELQTAQIATLMLQPLLENAVIYGVEPSQETTKIDVQVRSSRGAVEILVKNPIHETAEDMVQSVGGNRMAMKNIRERLMLLYDLEAELHSGEENGKYEVRLRFPYRRRLA